MFWHQYLLIPIYACMHVQQYFFLPTMATNQIEKTSCTLIKMSQIKIYTFESICTFAFNLYENVIEEKKVSSIPPKNRFELVFIGFIFSMVFFSLSHPFFNKGFFAALFLSILCVEKSEDKSSFFPRPNKIVVDSSWKMVMKIEKYKKYTNSTLPRGRKKYQNKSEAAGKNCVPVFIRTYSYPKIYVTKLCMSEGHHKLWKFARKPNS